MESKVQTHHTSKLAYIYLRQSTVGQVRFNQESTQRQYALQDKAQQMGWSQPFIKVLDGDLGISGSHSNNREDFKRLVADVSMGTVGAVFALEASRLSRSCTDWHRLLELCAMTETLIIDEDGCYNPGDFNDGLILGLKATMSYAELHFIRARLQGGKINKAKKGELKIPLPVGFCYDEIGRVKLDPDEQVRRTLRLLFNTFKERGSVYGVVLYFSENEIPFPKRAYGSVWKDKLLWGPLNYTRALDIIKNPCYAGAYVYGRRQRQRKVTPDGRIQVTARLSSINDWSTMIKEQHEGYISWEGYLENQDAIKKNQACDKRNTIPSTVREGAALLQGSLICGYCGLRLLTRYHGGGGLRPTYVCPSRKLSGLHTGCFSILAQPLDAAISEAILNAVEPFQIEIAINAFEELQKRSNELEKQWLMKIQRANYETQLARRRYEDVDSSNRLVAASLEKEWNESLIVLEKIRCQYAEYQKENVLTSINSQKEKILDLAKNLPLLWNAPSTCAKDRKRIVRSLIKDITIEKHKEEAQAILHIRWQGGALSDIRVPLPQKVYDRKRHSIDVINTVRELSSTMTPQQIVEKFNRDGLKRNSGTSFTVGSIEKIRIKHKILSPRWKNLESYQLHRLRKNLT